MAKRRILRARLGPSHVDDGRSEAGPRIDRRKRFDQRALAASVLADEKRDAVRDLEPTFANDLRHGRDRVWPLRSIGWLMRARRPVDVFKVPHAANLLAVRREAV